MRATETITEQIKGPTTLKGPVKGAPTQGRDSQIRSLSKALSWRASAFTITVGVVLLTTGEMAFAAAIGAADAAVKLGAYYLHERAWDRTSFGRRGR